MEPTVIPEDWPLAEQLRSVAFTALGRLELDRQLQGLTLVADDLAADDHAWWRLEDQADGRHLTLWFHPDHVLQDRPGRGAARRSELDWQLAPVPAAESDLTPEEFSAPNAQRFLYQQLLLVQDVVLGRLDPGTVPLSLVEAFQEAWLVTVDGRLKREGLPHLSEAERRLRFLRRFAPAGVVTPGHWGIFNGLWRGELSGQPEVLARVKLLPPLARRRRA